MSIQTRQLRTYLKITEKFLKTIAFDEKDYKTKVKAGQTKQNSDTEKFFTEARQRAKTLCKSLKELIETNEKKETEDSD